MHTVQQIVNGMVLTRLCPSLPVQSYKSYTVSAPLSSHWRNGTCEEADCPEYQHGWKTTVDLDSELGQRQAYYIVKESGRSFQVERHGQLVEFIFEAGQKCFTQHRIRLDRYPRFFVRGGDWRQNTGLIREHSNFENWQEDFALHQDRLKTVIERG